MATADDDPVFDDDGAERAAFVAGEVYGRFAISLLHVEGMGIIAAGGGFRRLDRQADEECGAENGKEDRFMGHGVITFLSLHIKDN